MALGGLAAYLHFYKKEFLLNFLYHPLVQAIALLVGFGGWICGLYFNYITDEFYSFFFAIIILNLATNPKPLFNLNWPFMEYLGKISYGIYVYHWVVILTVLYLIKNNAFLKSLNAYQIDLFLYPIILTLIIFISHISYFYFENFFLKKKIGYSKISMN